MADHIFMTDPATGNGALFLEPNTTGLPEDASAARNAPLNNPASHLADLYYHSDYDPIEVAFGPTNTTIAHATIPAGSGPGGVATVNGWLVYGAYAADNLLLTHNLGYEPDFVVFVGGQPVHYGYPVQYDPADGRARRLEAYATTTEIRLAESGIQSSVPLAGTTVTYTVMVFRRPPAPVGDVLFEFDPVTGITKMARDKFSSDRRYLQIVAGGTPFGFPLGRTIDLANGTFRSVQPNGTIRDVVSAAFKLSFGGGGPNYGPAGNYNGSFTGDPFILVQAP